MKKKVMLVCVSLLAISMLAGCKGKVKNTTEASGDASTDATRSSTTEATTEELPPVLQKKVVTTYDYDGTTLEVLEIEYDETGELETKRSTYTGYETLMTYTVTEYNDKGEVSKATTYNADDSLNNRVENRYTDGALKESRYYGHDDGLVQRIDYEIGEKGETLSATIYNGDNDKVREDTYDEKGNVTKETFMSPDGAVNSINTYDYDDNGNLVRKTYFTAQETVYSIEEYEYDKDGVLQTMSYYLGDGTWEYTDTYKYGHSPDGLPNKDTVERREPNPAAAATTEATTEDETTEETYTVTAPPQDPERHYDRVVTEYIYSGE